VKENKPGKPDVIVKFDKYLGKEWDKFYSKHWGKDAPRKQRGAGADESWLAARPGPHRSSLTQRVRNDMADADFVE
jgi:hypothetical protein